MHSKSQTDIFEHFLETHGPALVRLASCYTNSREETEDLSQEISMAIWKALGRFKGDSTFKTYAFRIAQNVGVTHLIKHRGRPPADPLDDELVDKHDIESEFLARGDEARLVTAMRQLPLNTRSALALYLEDLSVGDIAATLDISPAAVSLRLLRAKQQLRKVWSRL